MRKLLLLFLLAWQATAWPTESFWNDDSAKDEQPNDRELQKRGPDSSSSESHEFTLFKFGDGGRRSFTRTGGAAGNAKFSLGGEGGLLHHGIKALGGWLANLHRKSGSASNNAKASVRLSSGGWGGAGKGGGSYSRTYSSGGNFGSGSHGMRMLKASQGAGGQFGGKFGANYGGESRVGFELGGEGANRAGKRTRCLGRKGKGRRRGGGGDVEGRFAGSEGGGTESWSSRSGGRRSNYRGSYGASHRHGGKGEGRFEVDWDTDGKGRGGGSWDWDNEENGGGWGGSSSGGFNGEAQMSGSSYGRGKQSRLGSSSSSSYGFQGKGGEGYRRGWKQQKNSGQRSGFGKHSSGSAKFTGGSSSSQSFANSRRRKGSRHFTSSGFQTSASAGASSRRNGEFNLSGSSQGRGRSGKRRGGRGKQGRGRRQGGQRRNQNSGKSGTVSSQSRGRSGSRGRGRGKQGGRNGNRQGGRRRKQKGKRGSSVTQGGSYSYGSNFETSNGNSGSARQMKTGKYSESKYGSNNVESTSTKTKSQGKRGQKRRGNDKHSKRKQQGNHQGKRSGGKWGGTSAYQNTKNWGTDGQFSSSFGFTKEQSKFGKAKHGGERFDHFESSGSEAENGGYEEEKRKCKHGKGKGRKGKGGNEKAGKGHFGAFEGQENIESNFEAGGKSSGHASQFSGKTWGKTGSQMVGKSEVAESSQATGYGGEKKSFHHKQNNSKSSSQKSSSHNHAWGSETGRQTSHISGAANTGHDTFGTVEIGGEIDGVNHNGAVESTVSQKQSGNSGSENLKSHSHTGQKSVSGESSAKGQGSTAAGSSSHAQTGHHQYSGEINSHSQSEHESESGESGAYVQGSIVEGSSSDSQTGLHQVSSGSTSRLESGGSRSETHGAQESTSGGASSHNHSGHESETLGSTTEMDSDHDVTVEEENENEDFDDHVVIDNGFGDFDEDEDVYGVTHLGLGFGVPIDDWDAHVGGSEESNHESLSSSGAAEGRANNGVTAESEHAHETHSGSSQSGQTSSSSSHASSSSGSAHSAQHKSSSEQESNAEHNINWLQLWSEGGSNWSDRVRSWRGMRAVAREELCRNLSESAKRELSEHLVRSGIVGDCDSLPQGEGQSESGSILREWEAKSKKSRNGKKCNKNHGHFHLSESEEKKILAHRKQYKGKSSSGKTANHNANVNEHDFSDNWDAFSDEKGSKSKMTSRQQSKMKWQKMKQGSKSGSKFNQWTVKSNGSQKGKFSAGKAKNSNRKFEAKIEETKTKYSGSKKSKSNREKSGVGNIKYGSSRYTVHKGGENANAMGKIKEKMKAMKMKTKIENSGKTMTTYAKSQKTNGGHGMKHSWSWTHSGRRGGINEKTNGMMTRFGFGEGNELTGELKADHEDKNTNTFSTDHWIERWPAGENWNDWKVTWENWNAEQKYKFLSGISQDERYELAAHLADEGIHEAFDFEGGEDFTGGLKTSKEDTNAYTYSTEHWIDRWPGGENWYDWKVTWREWSAEEKYNFLSGLSQEERYELEAHLADVGVDEAFDFEGGHDFTGGLNEDTNAYTFLIEHWIERWPAGENWNDWKVTWENWNAEEKYKFLSGISQEERYELEAHLADVGVHEAFDFEGGEDFTGGVKTSKEDTNAYTFSTEHWIDRWPGGENWYDWKVTWRDWSAEEKYNFLSGLSKKERYELEAHLADVGVDEAFDFEGGDEFTGASEEGRASSRSSHSMSADRMAGHWHDWGDDWDTGAWGGEFGGSAYGSAAASSGSSAHGAGHSRGGGHKHSHSWSRSWSSHDGAGEGSDAKSGGNTGSVDLKLVGSM